MVQPTYIQQQPRQVYPSQQPGRFEPPAWPPRANTPPQAPPVVARGMMPEMPEKAIKPALAATQLAPLSMPSPEALGVAPASTGTVVKGVGMPSPEQVGVESPLRTAPVKVDWNEMHNRLERLGCIDLQTGQLNGSHRVALVLRTNQPDQVQHIAATAATEPEAVAAALARAEEWVKTGK